jgi:hypothetical protein
MRRDAYGIIGQTDVNDPNYFDFGDAPFSTGLMGFGGSNFDRNLMIHFITLDYKIVRHPNSTQNTGTHPHNDSRSVSRDQVIAFFSGIYDSVIASQVRKTCLQYAKGWRVNRDILGPAHKYYLYKCAGVKPSIVLTAFAYLHQSLSLVWDCYVKPNSEKNQSIVMNTIFGKRWIKFLYYNHPDLYKNIDVYFNGWRDRAEIGAGLKMRIGKEIFGHDSN